jgi:hypothetical protein
MEVPRLHGRPTPKGGAGELGRVLCFREERDLCRQDREDLGGSGKGNILLSPVVCAAQGHIPGCALVIHCSLMSRAGQKGILPNLPIHNVSVWLGLLIHK